ncbi:hypothetical protein INT48_008095 [Thamnidium elegans]|uniref:F-box domain-containing protein n=1 Tax=Thamnidium elegans TaxID=101142 RepID=A0A8H7SIP5_9FUNG|nr:hypothetical protein INT48_008095 [Thamnidium elegans]
MALVNKLPTEFLQKVSTYLCLQDCYECLFVCRLWHHTFQRNVYKTIHIQSTEQLKQFIISVSCYGLLVKEIYLSRLIDTVPQINQSMFSTQKTFVEFDQDTLLQINRFCPLLEVIDFGVSQWKGIDLNQLVLWNRMRGCGPIYFRKLDRGFLSVFGNQLTKLHVGYIPQEMESVLKKVVTMSTLQDLTLEIILNDDDDIVTLRWSDYLQKVHEALHGHVDSMKWFQFVTRNYPCLKELKLTQLSTSRFGTKWMWQSGLVDLIVGLPQLQSLTLGGRNIPQLFSDGLVKELKKPTCSVKNLYVDFETYQAIESCQFLLAVATHGLRQLKCLRLRVWEQIPGWSGVTSNLFQCHGLISLHLSLSKGLVDQFPFTNFLIDHFLKHLPQLEILVLVGANVQVTYNNYIDLEQHTYALRKLELIQSKVENHEVVFRYLSACCVNLNDILLKRCETERKRINLSGLLNAFTLDVRHCQLKKVVLSTLLIYVGTIQYNKFIGIQLKYGDLQQDQIIWCNAEKSMIYPVYYLNQDKEENEELNQLYKSYTSTLSDSMPGNYTPNIGVITIYCKSVGQVYLDNLKIK